MVKRETSFLYSSTVHVKTLRLCHYGARDGGRQRVPRLYQREQPNRDLECVFADLGSIQ